PRTRCRARGSRRTSRASDRGPARTGRRPGSTARPARARRRSYPRRRWPHGPTSWRLLLVRLRGCGLLFAPLGVDQLVEPADLALDRVEAVLLELEGVSVELLPGPGQRHAEAVAPLLHPPPAALQDAQPGLGVRMREEGEVHPEALVVVRRG